MEELYLNLLKITLAVVAAVVDNKLNNSYKSWRAQSLSQKEMFNRVIALGSKELAACLGVGGEAAQGLFSALRSTTAFMVSSLLMSEPVFLFTLFSLLVLPTSPPDCSIEESTGNNRLVENI